jgi:hypothetical protein
MRLAILAWSSLRKTAKADKLFQMRLRFTVWFEGLSSPENFSLFAQALCLIFGTVVFWVFFSIILSMLGIPLLILLTIGLVVLLTVRSRKSKQGERWANEGRCSQCGYDLRASPYRCPECGHDATVDEPAWRKMRRRREEQMNLPGAARPFHGENRQRLVSTQPPKPPSPEVDSE